MAGEKGQVWKKTTEQLSQWAGKVLGEVPVRCTPIVGMDLNSGLEPGKDEARSEAVGDFGNGKASRAAELMLRLAEMHDMAF
eukprot:9258195-Lingulodinium_polyedra.AAC.1